MSDPRKGLLVLLVSTVLFAQAKDDAATAFADLRREYDDAVQAYLKASDAAKSAEDKQKAYQDKFPHARLYAPRYFDLARKHPTVAVDALAWVVNHPVESSAREAGLRGQALQLLLDGHAGDDRVGKLCTGLVHTIDPDSEAFLRSIIEKSPTPGVQARACATLAHNLKYRARIVRLLADDADMRAQYEKTFAKPILDGLRARKADDLVADSRKRFEQVQAKFGDVKHPTHGTLAKLAEAHLESLKSPVALDQPAPEISGVDFDGKPMRLSDYKGRVVLLDFGSHDFPACRAKYDYERQLVKRLDGKPFVLLGVNADGTKAARQKVNLPWRAWWDGGDVGGPIATRWEVDRWPTLLVVDHRGVVRHIETGWPETKEIDDLLDKLVAAAAKDGK